MSETLHSVVIGLGEYGKEALTFLYKSEEADSTFNEALDIKLFIDGENFGIASKTEPLSSLNQSITQADIIFIIAENFVDEETIDMVRLVEAARKEYSLSIVLTPSKISENVSSDRLSHVDSVIEVPRMENNSTPQQPSATVIRWLLDTLTGNTLIGLDLSDLKLMFLSRNHICRCGFVVADAAYDVSEIINELTNGHNLTKADLSKAESGLIAFKVDLDCEAGTYMGILNAVEACRDEICPLLFSIMLDGKNGEIDILVIA